MFGHNKSTRYAALLFNPSNTRFGNSQNVVCLVSQPDKQKRAFVSMDSVRDDVNIFYRLTLLTLRSPQRQQRIEKSTA